MMLNFWKIPYRPSWHRVTMIGVHAHMADTTCCQHQRRSPTYVRNCLQSTLCTLWEVSRPMSEIVCLCTPKGSLQAPVLSGKSNIKTIVEFRHTSLLWKPQVHP